MNHPFKGSVVESSRTHGFRSRVLPGLLLVAAMMLVACDGGDDVGNGAEDDGAPKTCTCGAMLIPVQVDYVVNGDVLEFRAEGSFASWDRVEAGDPALPIYGTWRMVVEIPPPEMGTATADTLIEPGQVSLFVDCDFPAASADAFVTSAAEITETTMAILEGDEDAEIVQC